MACFLLFVLRLEIKKESNFLRFFEYELNSHENQKPKNWKLKTEQNYTKINLDSTGTKTQIIYIYIYIYIYIHI